MKISFVSFLFPLFLSTTPEAYRLPEKYRTFSPFRVPFPKEDTQQLIQRIQNHKITEIVISPDLKQITSIPNPLPPSADPEFIVPENGEEYSLRSMNLDVNQEGETYHTTAISPFLLNKIIDISVDNAVKTTFVQQPSFLGGFVNNFMNNPLGTIYELAFPLLLISFSIRMFTSYQQQMNYLSGRGGGGPRSNNKNQYQGGFPNFMNPQPPTNTVIETKHNVSLSDWAGSPEVFLECYEIISYLQNETAFKEVGAEVPRGILLEGPPGTGKTLLARAIASEVNASFISVVGSQFVEMFVGVGAMRIRELFQTARQNRPCVLFIDEIDAIGKQRNSGAGGPNFSGNDEREQTLNQLLAEMDGFQDNEGILFMAATNLKDTLDKALLRPGRFDRILSVPLPDTPSREKILRKYLDSKPVQPEQISIPELAELTAGFSGAELKNVINEALIHLVRRKNNQNITLYNNSTAPLLQNALKREDVNNALEKILIGIIKQNDTRSMEVQRRVALHELGHAVMVAEHKDEFDLQKISIQSTYSGVGGFTLFKPKKEWTEGGMYTKDFLEKRLQIMLGGRAAEEVFYGSAHVSLGATRDLEEANLLSKQMVEQYGMGGNKTNVYFRTDSRGRNGGFFGSGDTSETLKSVLEKEAYYLVSCAYQKTLEKVQYHKTKLTNLSQLLLTERVLYGNPFWTEND
jgi:cell division protease FtsH